MYQRGLVIDSQPVHEQANLVASVSKGIGGSSELSVGDRVLVGGCG